MVAPKTLFILGVTGVYLALIMGLGAFAQRFGEVSREDFYLANRSFGVVVLFFAIFATNATAITMIGIPGLTYESGASSLGFFTGFFMMFFPVFLLTAGYRFWLAGKRFGLITPGDFFEHRWNSTRLRLLVTGMLVFWSIPYLHTGVEGAGIAFEVMTDGAVPVWVGSLVIVCVVAVYVLVGGMRGTGWTNTVQGTIFVVFLLAMFVWLPMRIGGFAEATAAVASLEGGTYLNRAGFDNYTPRTWFSFGIAVAMGASVLPQLFIRVLTSDSVGSLKTSAVIYPVGIFVVYIPSVLIGFWGIAVVPGLDNPDFVLPAMIEEFLPFWVLAFALVAVLAAIMSSLDGIVLTLSTMFTVDLLEQVVDLPERREVYATRLFVVLVLAAAYVSATVVGETILNVAVVFLQGFATLFLPICAVVYWRGATEESILAGLLFGFVGIWAFLIASPIVYGFMAIVPLTILQALVMVGTASVTAQSEPATADAYENTFS